jgi:HEAT repeat protein
LPSYFFQRCLGVVIAPGALAKIYVATGRFGEIAQLLESDDMNVFFGAANSLSEMKTAPVIADLIKLLDDPNPRLRRAAAHILGTMKDRASANSIARLLDESDDDDPDGEVRGAAVSALIKTDSQEWADKIGKLLHSGNARVRMEVLQALGYWHLRDYAGPVMPLLNDSDSSVKANAFDALADMQATDFWTTTTSGLLVTREGSPQPATLSLPDRTTVFVNPVAPSS